MLSDNFLAGFRAGLRGRPSVHPAGAYDAADPTDLAEQERQQHAEGITALLRHIDAALAERLDGRARSEVMALINELAEHAARGVKLEPPPTAAERDGAADQEADYDALVAFIKSKLSSEDAARAIEILEGGNAAGDDEPRTAFWPAQPDRASGDLDDVPPHRLARPMEGGGLSLDGLPSKYYAIGVPTYEPRRPAVGTALSRALADSGRIKHDIYRPEPRRVAVRCPALASDAADDYTRMFPDTRRLG